MGEVWKFCSVWRLETLSYVCEQWQHTVPVYSSMQQFCFSDIYTVSQKNAPPSL